ELQHSSLCLIFSRSFKAKSTSAFGSFPPSPINVSFSSVNLRNVLHWLPGQDTPNDTHFTVQYAIYGESVDGGNQLKWMAVRQCTAIVRTWCDLSAQTSDLDDGYYARVRSVVRKKSSKWTGLQRRFDPKEETRLGPPLITVEVHNNTATITLKGPMRYQLNNQTTAISMAEIYTHMTYNLSVHNTHLEQMVRTDSERVFLQHHYVLQKGFFKYRLLSYNTKYCFSAQSRLLFMPIECQRSAWYCITTAQGIIDLKLKPTSFPVIPLFTPSPASLQPLTPPTKHYRCKKK
uniref:Fibronectin type-III domain-containing protein n=1 Tax=Oryzias latipes TaxID=8090 RepID=A0A3P9LN56_ORYLA